MGLRFFQNESSFFKIKSENKKKREKLGPSDHIITRGVVGANAMLQQSMNFIGEQPDTFLCEAFYTDFCHYKYCLRKSIMKDLKIDFSGL